MPAQWISSPGAWALPRIGFGAHGKLPHRNEMAVSLGIDIATGGIRIEASVAMPQPVEHQLCSIPKLNAEPVPPSFIGCHRAGEEFVIHPGCPLDLERFP